MFLEARALRKTYRLGETTVLALRGLNLGVERGEFTALVGASGSGKTTLMNMLGCIDKPDAGTILLDGTDVGALDEDAQSDFRNRKIGFIFQSFNLLPVLNVYENVELPLLLNKTLTPETRREMVMASITDVGLENHLHHIPDKLSGGQRQRVAIARALVARPELVLADEPTANLDSTTTHKIIDLMQELNQKRRVTFLFSTHDEKLMSRVGRVLHIQDGLLQETSLP